MTKLQAVTLAQLKVGGRYVKVHVTGCGLLLVPFEVCELPRKAPDEIDETLLFQAEIAKSSNRAWPTERCFMSVKSAGLLTSCTGDTRTFVDTLENRRFLDTLCKQGTVAEYHDLIAFKQPADHLEASVMA